MRVRGRGRPPIGVRDRIRPTMRVRDRVRDRFRDEVRPRTRSRNREMGLGMGPTTLMRCRNRDGANFDVDPNLNLKHNPETLDPSISIP